MLIAIQVPKISQQKINCRNHFQVGIALVSLAEYSQQLQVLKADCCPKLSSDSVQRVALACKNLRCLYLASDSLPTYNPFTYPLDTNVSRTVYEARINLESEQKRFELSSKVLSCIANHCVRLTEVNFANQSFVDDNVVIKLATNCTQLTSITISQCTLCTDTTVIHLAYKLSQVLTNVDISGCARITDNGLCTLAKRCVKLSVLRVNDLHRLTNRSMAVLAVYAVKLTRIDIRNCVNLTDSTLRYFCLC